MYKKLKYFIAGDVFFTVSLMMLVGVVSFGLGRQSVTVQSSVSPASQASGVIFTDVSKPTTPMVDEVGVSQDTEKVVASRSGTKYHRLDCPGAARIKDENKLFFDSIDMARSAGYTPAANCPGLQ